MQNLPLAKRLEYSSIIRRNYPTMVPVVVRTPRNETYIKLIKDRYLVPEEITVRRFLTSCRPYIGVKETHTVFILIDDMTPRQEDTMGLMYQKHRNMDGFLYITLSSENTFG